jgi:hypothetical protein
MADYRRLYDDTPRRHESEWPDRASDEVRPWFRDGERNSRYETDRGTRWEAAPEDRSYGMYRTDDRAYHDRYRQERGNSDSAANEYYRAARDQRDDYLRWAAHNPEDWGVQHLPSDSRNGASFGPRERGGYWRQYEASRRHYVGRGPKGYQRSDDRIREEICDCMTEDPALDASEIEIEVRQGEVLLSGSVASREQKRRAEDVAERISGVRDVTNQLRVTRDGNGHNWAADSSRAAGPGYTSPQPVSEASGKGTPSKSTSGTTA